MPAPKRPSKVKQIAPSIREFGFTNPVLISPENDIIARKGAARSRRSPFPGVDAVFKGSLIMDGYSDERSHRAGFEQCGDE
jgi:hypothetical protein